ncbi:hypothetical protein BY996DRAFT_4619978 [Phakopsora pachyrhizi]|uniref:Expressed protein n=1 Tax=Phakopsora pachyrhizi TaxID=170000 RepID=A0AAV0AWY1_PHAPC|nr:hypothetical protein BY996DRAFT_4619978 [Phakopsora pachyrhizi]CAH7673690.1 expressed protein [Phakopsora pachyrhizi]
MMKRSDSSLAVVKSLSSIPLNCLGSCLNWSNDGQALVVTRTNIYILTPILGYRINKDDLKNLYLNLNKTKDQIGNQDNNIRDTPNNQSSVNDSDGLCHLPMVSTVIDIDKSFGVDWSAHSNDNSIVTPSGVDKFWRCACWSPSFLTNLGSSLLVTLTSNFDVLVFTPDQNFQTALWKLNKAMNLSEELLRIYFELPQISSTEDRDNNEVFDVTPELKLDQSIESIEKRRRFTSCVLKAQTTSISWSPAYIPTYNQVSADDMCGQDFSLLALGHRRGDLSLWRHTSCGNMELVYLNPICTDGCTINVLTWSDWTLQAHKTSKNKDSRQLSAFLALANSKGLIYVLKVKRNFVRSIFGALPIVQINVELHGIYHDESSKSAVTGLTWLKGSEKSDLSLILVRLGELVAFKVKNDSEFDKNFGLENYFLSAQVLKLPELQTFDQKLSWAECTSLAPCSGISVIPDQHDNSTNIILTLSSGLIYNIKHSEYKQSNHSVLITDNSSFLEVDLDLSIKYSLDFRRKFYKICKSLPINQAHKNKVSRQTVMKIFGSSVNSNDRFLKNFNRNMEVEEGCNVRKSYMMSWAFEVSNPNKFRYKPENLQSLQFCMADLNVLAEGNDFQFSKEAVECQGEVFVVDQVLERVHSQVEEIVKLLKYPVPSIYVTPVWLLFNFFKDVKNLFLNKDTDDKGRDGSNVNVVCKKIVEILKFKEEEEECDSVLKISEESVGDGLGDDGLVGTIGSGFGQRLEYSLSDRLVGCLFNNLILDQLRLKSNICNYLLEHVEKQSFGDFRKELIRSMVAISRSIHFQTIKLITKFFNLYKFLLTEDDKEVFGRYLYALDKINKSPELSLELLLDQDEFEHKLLDRDRLFFKDFESKMDIDNNFGTNTDEEEEGYDMFKHESCPACGQKICFDNLRFGICKVGHLWDRCSITFKILSCEKLRVCLGCGSKSIRESVLDDEGKSYDWKNKRRRMTDDEDNEVQKEQVEYDELTEIEKRKNKKVSFVDILLKLTKCCIHCGCRWKFT